MIRLAPMITALGLTAAVVAGTGPAVAQDPTPAPTVYAFSLPGSVASGVTSFTLPGDLVTRKSRDGKALGKVDLADVATKVARLRDKGRSFVGFVTVKGTTREMKGVPVLLADGRVKLRVAQGRGSRALVIPREGGRVEVKHCPPSYTAVTDYSVSPPATLCIFYA